MRRWVSVIATTFVFASLGLSPLKAATTPERVEVPEMKTSIYVGTVTLSLTTFERSGESYAADYVAKVRPWHVGSETGKVTLAVPDAEFERLLRGETIELVGEARTPKGAKHEVSAKVRPTDASTGKIKVRVGAGGTQLIFNGFYRFADPATSSSDAAPDSQSPANPAP